MNNSVPFVLLSDLLKPVKRREVVEPAKSYQILGAHWYAKGLYTKDVKTGGEIRAKYLYCVKRGDFVYNRLFGWKGSFALATEENDDCCVSNEFPCFQIDHQKLDGRYLWKYFTLSSTWDRAFGLSSGGTPTSRNRLKEEKFLAMRIPLPPLDEQRRIVKRIESLAAKIEDACRLKERSAIESATLGKAVASRIFISPDTPLGQLCNVTKLAGFEYTKYFTHALPGKITVVRAGNVRNTGLDLSSAMTITEEVSEALPRSQLKADDVIMTFIGAKIGDVTYVRPDHPRLHCGPNVAKITPNHDLSTAYLVKVLQSPLVQEQIEQITKTTAQPSLSMKTIRQLEVPVPPLEQQRRVVAYLDSLQAKVDSLRKHQENSEKELNALMPSILSKAFNGEL